MNTEEVKSAVSAHEIPEGFIKTTEKPLGTLTSEQKAVLNRKGNALFNDGKYDAACRIFVTTGYSDGLARIGDLYKRQNKELQALKYYRLANSKRKSEPIIERLAGLISKIIK